MIFRGLRMLEERAERAHPSVTDLADYKAKKAEATAGLAKLSTA